MISKASAVHPQINLFQQGGPQLCRGRVPSLVGHETRIWELLFVYVLPKSYTSSVPKDAKIPVIDHVFEQGRKPRRKQVRKHVEMNMVENRVEYRVEYRLKYMLQHTYRVKYRVKFRVENRLQTGENMLEKGWKNK